MAEYAPLSPRTSGITRRTSDDNGPSGRRAYTRILGLGVLCLISLCGWILAFWVSLNPNSITLNLELPTTETTGGLITESSNAGLSISEILDGSWKPKPHSLQWAGISEVLLVDRERDTNRVSAWQVKDDRDSLAWSHDSISALLESDDFWISPGAHTALVVSNKTKEWRRSFRGLYWLLDLNTSKLEPLDPERPSAPVQLASFSPQGDVTFVRDGNLHLRRSKGKIIEPITMDTDPAVMYGIPGWVYEEEVLESNSALWWSDDGRYLAFLHTDESMVETYMMQINHSKPYPEDRLVRYPKAGRANPKVDLQVYDLHTRRLVSLNTTAQLPDDQRVIFSVVWLSSYELLMKQTNRESQMLMVFLINVQMGSSRLIRVEEGANRCWVEPVRETVRFVPADSRRGRPQDGYIDLVEQDGYNHLAYFTPVHDSTPAMNLTAGKWEVVDAPLTVDLEHNWVYFLGTVEHAPDQRHLYRISLDEHENGSGHVHALTDTSQPGYYSASFAPGGRYALLTNEGPGVPHTALVALNEEDVKKVANIELNHNLVRKTQAAVSLLPQRRFFHTDLGNGLLLPVMELLPPKFDSNRQYPVIFHVYGGPGSQKVSQKFKVDYQSFLASQNYVVVTVDGRGTGFNGRAARCIVQDRLGHYEAQDQIFLARLWREKPYIDAARMAIWGWSFGGYLTLKVLELDAGNTFRVGIAVAPVTDWRFYGQFYFSLPQMVQPHSKLILCGIYKDSLFTERHMHTPQHNAFGYENAAITNMTALSHVQRILLAHGLADDNAHVQNTLTLVDKLVAAEVDNYDVLLFPDSDHDIMFHGGKKMLYQSEY
ncbi:dipeptidyl-aminopeptidase B [Penicillium soppii]|uniref:dipeptidyl-aminopeptidase B n=1 Tax=Penicillium soppii TaxID=69789 RepID=UPI002548B9F8|nr:dipeptidyl-aminopeptidase B [Penicillium soppii]KAJ5863652.1 dipeptidyl-aminopeptidase B [Penicillium soppii]